MKQLNPICGSQTFCFQVFEFEDVSGLDWLLSCFLNAFSYTREYFRPTFSIPHPPPPCSRFSSVLGKESFPLTHIFFVSNTNITKQSAMKIVTPPTGILEPFSIVCFQNMYDVTKRKQYIGGLVCTKKNSRKKKHGNRDYYVVH